MFAVGTYSETIFKRKKSKPEVPRKRIPPPCRREEVFLHVDTNASTCSQLCGTLMKFLRSIKRKEKGKHADENTGFGTRHARWYAGRRNMSWSRSGINHADAESAFFAHLTSGRTLPSSSHVRSLYFRTSVIY
jgi:hypothetical protein